MLKNFNSHARRCYTPNGGDDAAGYGMQLNDDAALCRLPAFEFFPTSTWNSSTGRRRPRWPTQSCSRAISPLAHWSWREHELSGRARRTRRRAPHSSRRARDSAAGHDLECLNPSHRYRGHGHCRPLPEPVAARMTTLWAAGAAVLLALVFALFGPFFIDGVPARCFTTIPRWSGRLPRRSE
jgi:hypothetical protein